MAAANTPHNSDVLWNRLASEPSPGEEAMLSDYFRDQRHLERLRCGPVGSFAEGFVERLEGLRRAKKTVQNYLGSLRHFALWLTVRGLTLASFDQRAFEAFSRHASTRHCIGRKASQCDRLVPHVQEFLVHARGLRGGPSETELALGVRRRGRKARAKPELLQRFERWMAQSRQVAASTLKLYR